MTPWTVACQTPLSMGLSRQEYWNGLPFPSPWDLPDPGIESGSPVLQVDSLPPESPGKSLIKGTRTCQSSTLAWKIPWMEELGRLQSMGSLRVGHNWVTSLSLFPFMHWRRKWQPTPVFLPGESLGWQGLVGFCLWGCTESDTTEAT